MSMMACQEKTTSQIPPLKLAMFKITQGKGFQITFKNGWMISTQFGPGSYIEKRRMELGDFSEEGHRKAGEEGSIDAEIMVFPPEGKDYEQETPVGWQTPEQFATLVADISSRP